MNLQEQFNIKRIVTLEGDIVNPGGAMTGGGMRQSKSILAQKMNWQQ